MNRLIVALLATSLLGTSTAFAQIRLPGTGDLKLPSLSDIMRGEAPLTTSINDVHGCYGWPELDDLKPAEWVELTAEMRQPDGTWKLQPGSYKVTIQTFCGKGYTYGPTKGDGYVYAKFRGSKSEFFKSILKKYSLSDNVDQRDMQLLIWAVLSRVKPQDMNGGAKRALVALASDGDLKMLGDGALDYFSDQVSGQIFRSASRELRPVLEFENKMRGMFRDANRPFEEFERLAILPPPADLRTVVPEDRWNIHPNGYIYRLKSTGYSQSTMEIIVPRKHKLTRDDLKRVIAFEGDDFALKLIYDDSVEPMPHPTDPGVKAWKVKGIWIKSGRWVVERDVDDWILQGAPTAKKQTNSNADILIRMIRPVNPLQDWGTWGGRYQRARETRERILTYEEWYQREQRIARGEDPDGDVFDAGHIRDLFRSLFGGTNDRLEQIADTHGRLAEHLSHATGLLGTLPDGSTVDPSGDVHIPGSAGGQRLLGSSATR
ncbi:hypothetical protein QPK87_14255 [Kamptonema cortianum]|nr:hypothetical protein [Geitlerinema splendidum]MDK3157730.1 hypothetical protein [Kamptonema cortianum]